jgi:Ras-like without CAAX 2
MSIGIEFFIKDLLIDETHPIRLQIWDFYTEKRFRYLLPKFLKGSHGILFLFSITDKSGLTNFEKWYSIIQDHAPNIPILLVGTKLDLEDRRNVSKQEVIAFSEQYNCIGYVEISTKKLINIDEPLERISQAMWESNSK